MDKRRLILKIVLSGLILYHLAAVILLPNSSSLAGRKLGRYFITYANTFALNTAWVFFSPGPAPTYYLEYEVEKDVDNESPEPPEAVVHQYPVMRKSIFDDGYNRRLYEMRFFTLNDERTEHHLIPYLCRQHPEADYVTVQSIVERLPDLEKAADMADAKTGYKTGYKEMSERTELPRKRYSCERES